MKYLLILLAFFFAYCYNRALNNNEIIYNTTECPVGWYYLNGRCLLISKMAVTFANAIKACAEYSGVLASIHSYDEANSIYGRREDRNDLYIGLHVPTNLSGDTYVNLDGTQPDWKSFSPGPWEACAVTNAWSECCTIYYVKLKQVPCDFLSDGYICEIATDKWDRLKSDMALKANAQIIANYSTVIDHLESIKNGMIGLTAMKDQVNQLYAQFLNSSH